MEGYRVPVSSYHYKTTLANGFDLEREDAQAVLATFAPVEPPLFYPDAPTPNSPLSFTEWARKYTTLGKREIVPEVMVRAEALETTVKEATRRVEKEIAFKAAHAGEALPDMVTVQGLHEGMARLIKAPASPGDWNPGVIQAMKAGLGLSGPDPPALYPVHYKIKKKAPHTLSAAAVAMARQGPGGYYAGHASPSRSSLTGARPESPPHFVDTSVIDVPHSAVVVRRDGQLPRGRVPSVRAPILTRPVILPDMMPEAFNPNTRTM